MCLQPVTREMVKADPTLYAGRDVFVICGSAERRLEAWARVREVSGLLSDNEAETICVLEIRSVEYKGSGCDVSVGDVVTTAIDQLQILP